jgi:hypothetical protein
VVDETAFQALFIALFYPQLHIEPFLVPNHSQELVFECLQ